MSIVTGKTDRKCEWDIGDDVFVNDTRTIKARVTGIVFYTNRTMVLCEWFHCGEAKANWFDDWRLTWAGQHDDE